MKWLVHEVLWENKNRLIASLVRGGGSLGYREVRGRSLSLASASSHLPFVGYLFCHDDLNSIQLVLDVLHVELSSILVR